MDSLPELWILTLVGFVGGALLGAASRLGGFCTLVAIEDGLYGRDWRRLRMWALAIAIGATICFGASALDLIALEKSRALTFNFAPLPTLLGGVVFGYGMALVGTCGFGALARLGGGDLRGLVIAIVIGVSAYLVVFGLLADVFSALFARSTVEPGALPPSIAHYLAETLGASVPTVGVALAVALAFAAMFAGKVQLSMRSALWSALAGIAVASGWISTSWIAQHGFEATVIESHSYTAPIGETLFFAMTGSLGAPGFSVASVIGVIAGGAIGALIRGDFRWDACDDARELRRQIFGAALMGIGGVIALGCTIGQGLSAFALFAFSAPVAMIGVFFGAWAGLHMLIAGNRNI